MSPSDRRISGSVIHAVRIGPVSVTYSPRAAVVGVLGLVVLAAVILFALMSVRADLSPEQTLRAVLGDGDARSIRSVRSRALPRALTAACVGGLLGVSGAVFQSLSRNVLGSPDIIGFTAGAATAAGLTILFVSPDVLPVALAAATGGLLTAAIVYTLARTRGSANGIRLVLVGIGVAATVSAVLDLMLLTADIRLATQVQDWRAGSLSGRGWEHARSVLLATVVLIPGLTVLRRGVDAIELGDSAASGLGVPVERTRFTAIILATLAACTATAVAGPIAFIALAGPHIARFITRIPGVTILHSFVTGAVLLLLADHATQHIDIGLRAPVGLVTGVLGGAYLLILLTRSSTRT
ncbi:FecCD family ABC transporter permease [Corynebacterium sp. TAE3-ERU16]|uniref:FecCD family ABC transporter permease n=1 Tax=Corynebacterium sp. TAE3-ERU16 TaxID=2849493 RepID=UPI001C48E70A|nr:iron chelate uptake ABC transporter family permease subunit [Corynebacterium sp. TAE3-ERU16]